MTLLARLLFLVGFDTLLRELITHRGDFTPEGLSCVFLTDGTTDRTTDTTGMINGFICEVLGRTGGKITDERSSSSTDFGTHIPG